MRVKYNDTRKAGFPLDAVVLALSLLPLALGFLSRIGRRGHWFGDYEAVACAAQRAMEHGRLYDLHLACPGMEATVFVYPPWTAHVVGFVERFAGLQFTTALYGAAYIASAAFLIRMTLSDHGSGEPLWRRAPFLAFVAGGALRWGNIAVVAHGAIVATAWAMPSADLLLALTIGLMGTIKPVFLTYGALFLVAERSWGRRAINLSIAAAISGAAYLMFWRFGGDEATQWSRLVRHFVLVDNSGFSLLGWLSWLHLDLGGVTALAVYAVYAAAVCGSGLWIAESRSLSAGARLWLGVTLAALLNPRLMTQDLLAIGPGVLAVIAALPAAWKPAARIYLLVLCVVSGLLAISGGRVGYQLAMLVLFASLIGTALALWLGSPAENSELGATAGATAA